MASFVLFSLFTLVVYLRICVAYKYVVSINDDLGPCENGMPYIDKYADMSNIKFTKLNEDVLLVDGNMTTLIDFPPFPPTNRFVVHTKYFRKERGAWTQLPMKQVFPDFCAVLFSPLEIWYPVSNQLKGDARKCPPPKGVRKTYDSMNFDHY